MPTETPQKKIEKLPAKQSTIETILLLVYNISWQPATTYKRKL